MEMKGIDLTKYNNLRFRAVIDRRMSTGTIRQDRGTFISLTTMMSRYHMSYEKFLCLIESGNTTFLETVISDFEIVPRDPETYMDWQVGDKVDNPTEHWDLEASKEVIFRSGELIICKNKNGDISGGYTCGQLHRLGYRLVLTDIEKQIIEDRKKAEWKPQDGGVCYAESSDGYCTPFIYRHTGLNRTAFYAAFDKWGNVLTYHGNAISKKTLKMLRPATEEEKQRLFDAMAKEGKRWNAEKKVVEDIPKLHEFKKGEPVLVRDDHISFWEISIFEKMIENKNLPYLANSGHGTAYQHKYCLPYNEKTMHLLGTSNDYMEE